MHGRTTSGGVLSSLAQGLWQWVLRVLWVGGWDLHGSDFFSARPKDSQSNWDLGNLGSMSKHWALCHIPQVIPEQFLGCVVAYLDYIPFKTCLSKVPQLYTKV